MDGVPLSPREDGASHVRSDQFGEIRGGTLVPCSRSRSALGSSARLLLARPRGLHPRAHFSPSSGQSTTSSTRNGPPTRPFARSGALSGQRWCHPRATRIGIAPEGLWCDALEFEGAIERHEWQRALSLYRGEFLDGLHLSGCLAFERWQAAERTRFQGAATRAAWSLADADQADGRLESAVEWARKAIAFSSHDEKGVRRLILLLDGAGERAGALDAYEAYARLLREELEVDPDPETQALAAQLRMRTQRAPQPTGSVRSMVYSSPQTVEAWHERR